MSLLALAKTLAIPATDNGTPAPIAKIAKTTRTAEVECKAEVGILYVAPKRPDTDAFEERAAIAEYDGGLTRADAEKIAAQCQRYDNVIAFRAMQEIKI